MTLIKYSPKAFGFLFIKMAWGYTNHDFGQNLFYNLCLDIASQDKKTLSKKQGFIFLRYYFFKLELQLCC